MDIKETKELIKAVQDLLDELYADSEDGKLTLLEILGNYPEVMKIIDEGKDYNVIVNELKDLDRAELIELSDRLITIVYTILDIIKNLKNEKVI